MGLRFNTGANSDVDTSAEQLTTENISTSIGILVKASSSNTGIIYVGGSDVTAGTTDATDGFELDAGESLFLEGRNANEIYVIASIANQRVSYIVI